MEKVVVKVECVGGGEQAVKAVSEGGFVIGEIPAPGYVIQLAGPGSVPLFVRDDDLKKARELYDKKGHPVTVIAESWGE